MLFALILVPLLVAAVAAAATYAALRSREGRPVRADSAVSIQRRISRARSGAVGAVWWRSCRIVRATFR